MKDYIFTKDVVNLFTNRYGLNLNINQVGKIQKLENEFIDSIRDYLPRGYQIKVLDKLKFNEFNNENLLFLDDVYFNKKGEEISVTRTIPFEKLGKNDAVKILPRFGSESLDIQISKLQKKEYSVVDCGVFSGHTLYDLISEFRDKGIKINKAYLGVCNKNSIIEIKGKSYLAKVDNTSVEKKASDLELIIPDEGIFDFGEWIELRDMLGFDGRSVYSTNRTFKCYSTDLHEHASIDRENEDSVVNISNLYHNKIMNVVKQTNPEFEFKDTKVKQEGDNYILRTVVCGGLK